MISRVVLKLLVCTGSGGIIKSDGSAAGTDGTDPGDPRTGPGPALGARNSGRPSDPRRTASLGPKSWTLGRNFVGVGNYFIEIRPVVHVS